ncbi:MAG: hypothetical protein ACI906_002847 [Candidatus Latescibacterota bacterium]|jgi:hypothetical protein
MTRMERHVRRSHQPFAGPQLRYICCEDLWRPIPPPTNVDVECAEAGPRMDPLYDLPFEHGLGQRGQTERPDRVAAVAQASGKVIGIAAASADHPDMWQIGVDVEKGFRSGGIGAALVSGFAPAWTEAYVYVPRPQRIAGDYLGLKRQRATSP